jgi:hypothetical protein
MGDTKVNKKKLKKAIEAKKKALSGNKIVVKDEN